MKLNSDSIPPEILEKLHRIIGAVIDPLGKDLLTNLATSQIEGEVSNSRLQYMIEQHRADITKILQDLCKQGYFLSENKGRWTTYHLNTHYLSDNLDNSKNNMDTSLPAIATTLTPKLDTSSSNMDTSSSNVDTSISMDTLPLVTGKSRMKKEDLEQIILNVCKSEHKTLDEIGHLIDKAPKHLKNNIIPSLVASGKLERLFPNIPNHPNQAYKSAE